jgi:uncharacterized ion transporter superfamily protein YfcC
MSTAFRMPHALVMMLIVISATVALTYVIPSGTYERRPDGLVVPGSFHAVRRTSPAVCATFERALRRWRTRRIRSPL